MLFVFMHPINRAVIGEGGWGAVHWSLDAESRPSQIL